MHLRKRNESGANHDRAPESREGGRDADLVLAARRGDKRAFVEIVARYQAMVCGIALGILGDFAASEDAAQEAFLTAWRKFGELREPERLRGWLAQIARNAALGARRGRRDTDSLDEGADLPDSTPGPDELAAKTEELELVRDTLAKLPETYRLPLILYYREGQSIRAVAETLAISEDAVKQRLTRGREMVREQMAGLVESVLTRTAPSAILTMAVAAAIGALAAPSVVAGSVFAAAASAASGTGSAATASSTPILTFMSSTKGFLITAALVAAVSVPVGYGIRTGQPSSNGAKPQTNELAAKEFTNTAPRFGDSALFPEWRKLHETYGTGSEAMPVLHKAIGELKEASRRRAFHAALIAEWVQVDPKGGFSFFSAKGRDGGQRHQFFAELLAADPRAAIDSFLATGEPWKNVVRDMLTEIAKRAPERIAEIVSPLPKPENYWDTKVREAFAVAAAANLADTRTAAEAMTGPNREQALAGVACAMAKSDPNGAIAWARSLPAGIDHDELIRCALIGLASVNAAAALDQVGLVPPGGKQGYFATSTGARVLAEAVKDDFDGTLAWVASHPGRLTSEDLLGMAQPVTERLNADPEGFLASCSANGSLSALVSPISSALLNGSASKQGTVWEWLRAQPDNEGIRALKQDVLNAAAWQDPTLALKMAKDLPMTAEGDTERNTLANSLLNGGSMLYRFDSVFNQASDSLRAPLLKAAFSVLRGENMLNPQTWIDRLSELQEADRTWGTQRIAQGWAERSPEEAISWVQSLPAGDARSRAAASVASIWAVKDEASTSQWLNSMPPGLERDKSAEALAMAISDRNPPAAWDWALRINDPAQREEAAKHVAQIVAMRDLATAQQWIEASPFPSETKAQLQAALPAAPTGIGP